MQLHTGDDPSRVHCRVCGTDCRPKYEGWWHFAVCSQECFDEFRWRETLRIMRKRYYPDPNTGERAVHVDD